MSESTENASNGAMPNTEDEWVPRELIEATPAPLFRRFAPSRNDRQQLTGQHSSNRHSKRRFEPSEPAAPPPPQRAPGTRPPAIDPSISRRLDEVERSVAKAAAAADRSASNLQTIILGNRSTDRSAPD
jgi:hypothetical protein